MANALNQTYPIPLADGGTNATTNSNAIDNLISGATISTATVAGADKVIVQDADDSDNLKTVTATSIAGLAPQGDVVGPGSATDDALAKFDGTTGKLIQNSVGVLTDAGALSGLTNFDVDNININGNTVSSTDTNGQVAIAPDGTGSVSLSSNTVYIGQDLINAGDPTTKLTTGSATMDFIISSSSTLDLDGSGVRLGGANSRVTTILDEDDMASDSATALATQQSIKAYVDGIAGLSTVDNTSTSVTMAANTKYINTSTASAQVTYTIPATAAVGVVFEIVGKATGGWVLQANTGQTVQVGESATSTAGSVTNDGTFDVIRIVCIEANTTFSTEFVIGKNLTVA